MSATATRIKPIAKPMLKLCFSVALIIGLTGCEQAANAPDSESQTTSNAVTGVTDFDGNNITLDKPASKIVALAPHIVENIFSAGAGEQLIGVVNHSDYPVAAKNLPIVGGYSNTNIEKIVELNPDLIIGWKSGNASSGITQLRDLGFQVYIDQPDTLQDVAKSIRDIGTLTGHTHVAEEAAVNYLNKINELEDKFKAKTPVTAFYQVWNEPLQTINGSHIISDAIALCGGVNIYADEPVIAPVINLESILERDPTAIIASGMSSARPEWLDEWKTWPSLSAVQHNNLFFVDPDHIQRHTVRIVFGIESICTQLDVARERLAIEE